MIYYSTMSGAIVPTYETYGGPEACWKGREKIGAAELTSCACAGVLRISAVCTFFEAHESCEKTLFLLCLYKSSLFE
jgi:hypothetical protein